MNKENIFDYFLILTGLRKEIHGAYENVETVNVLPEKRIVKFLQRELLLTNNKYTKNNYSQPRNITRDVYEKKYNKDLSPRINIENPLIEGLETFSINRNLEIEFERHKNKTKWKNNIITVLSWCYTVFIIILLWFQPVYTIVYIIENKGEFSYYGPTLCFNLIFPIQYMLSIKYYSTDHLEKFYKSTDKHINKHMPHIGYLCCIVFMLVIVYEIVAMILLITGKDDKQFPKFYNFSYTNKIVIGVFLVIKWFYGRMTLGMNMILFCLIFSKHCIILKKFTNKISRYERANDTNYSINILTQEVIKIKYELDNSIDNFKNFFSFITFLGAICIGILLQNAKNSLSNSIPWLSLVIYFIFQGMFLIIIWKVDEYRDELADYITSVNFINKFLLRYNTKKISDKFEDTQMILLNIAEENATSIDWIILHRILSQYWSEFTILGIPISNGVIIQRGIALVALIVTFNSFFSN